MSTKKPDETLVVRRRGGDRIVAIHKINGVTVGRAQVVRYSTDADIFLTGADHVVEKLAKEEKMRKTWLDPLDGWDTPDPLQQPQASPDESDPRNLKAGDRVVVEQTGAYRSFLGDVVDTDPDDPAFPARINGADNIPLWLCSKHMVGKIVPCGELKAGDEVYCTKSAAGMKHNFVDTIIRQIYCGKNESWETKYAAVYTRDIVGKLIRFKR